MTWFIEHFSDILTLTGKHVYLAGVPLVLGLIIAIPLGWLAGRYKALYPPLIIGTGLLYTIPSLALFILMPVLIGTRILDPINVVVAMTIYTVACSSARWQTASAPCPTSVNQSATAMGFNRLRRLLHGGAAAGGPGHLGGPARSRGEQRQHRQRRRHHRRAPARVPSSPTGSGATSLTRSWSASSRASCWPSCSTW